MAADLSRFAVGGAAARPDSFTGLDPAFAQSLAGMFAAAPPDVQKQLRVTSAYRSPETQAKLFADAVAKYGSEQAARKWVAPPGKSQHNHGNAVDLNYLGDAAKAWAHANAAQYGLHFPLGHEDWHIEPVGARSGAQPAAMPGAPAPAAFGDVVGPKPVFAPPGLADVIGGYMQRKASKDQEAAAEQQRRAALAQLFT